MTAPLEREFAVFERGEMREEILRNFRLALRQFNDPATGQPFTEDQIRRVTMFGSRFYAEAEGVDLVGLAHQKRDEFLATQLRIDRAASPFLIDYHGALWGQELLAAAGGSGPVLAKANVGVVWNGSTTVPDPLAVTGRDPAGNRYQVFIGGATPGSGQIPLTLVGITKGRGTNPPTGTVITWENPPIGAQPTATVTSDFTGGLDRETDQDYAKRLMSRIRHKPGSGNWSDFRTTARAVSVAVDDAFVYPCAWHAGSVAVVVVQKRGTTRGPLAKIPGVALLTQITQALVPPGSPTIPGRAYVVVLAPVATYANAAMQLDMKRASALGWTDLNPWPLYSNAFPSGSVVSNVTSQTLFQIQASTDPTIGVVPSLMHWQRSDSSFQKLNVASVVWAGGTTYTVTLAAAPDAPHVIALGDVISPDTARRDLIAGAASDYFDELGPGEMVASNDVRFARAYRNPEPAEERPMRAGQQIVSRVSDAFGFALADAFLAYVNPAAPALPPSNSAPRLLVLGAFGVYPLT